MSATMMRRRTRTTTTVRFTIGWVAVATLLSAAFVNRSAALTATLGATTTAAEQAEMARLELENQHLETLNAKLQTLLHTMSAGVGATAIGSAHLRSGFGGNSARLGQSAAALDLNVHETALLQEVASQVQARAVPATDPANGVGGLEDSEGEKRTSPCVKVDDSAGIEESTANFCLAPEECQERLLKCKRSCIEKCWMDKYARGGAAPGYGDMDQQRLTEISSRTKQMLADIGIDLDCTPCSMVGSSVDLGKKAKDAGGNGNFHKMATKAASTASASSQAKKKVKDKNAEDEGDVQLDSLLEMSRG